MLCNLFTVSRYQSDHVSFVHWMGTEILRTGQDLALDSSFIFLYPLLFLKQVFAHDAPQPLKL